ncbi:MAG: hypothetical protein H6733_11430 [Alphaproteobacteria bacterium]|nr:hypothetical protein [Alphaproteobacteria bacterium]
MTARTASDPGGCAPVAGPVWFTRAPGDHRPALLQLPAALDWFAIGDAVGCWWRDVAWVPVGDRVVALPCPDRPDVLPVPDGVVLRGQRSWAAVRIPPDGGLPIVRWSPHARVAGVTLEASRSPWWTVDGLDVPDGARRARRLDVAPSGRIVVWADGGWLHRLDGDRGRVAVVGAVRDDERVAVGPGGAVVVGDGHHWLAGAAARGTLVAFQTPLARAAGIRWAPDGSAIAGSTHPEPGQDDAVGVDLRDGADLWRRGGALVLSATVTVTPGDGSVAGTALTADDVGVDGVVVSGPGGGRFDVATGARLGDGEPPGDVPADVRPCAPRWEALGFEDAFPVAGRTVLTSLDGHLAVLPPAPITRR